MLTQKQNELYELIVSCHGRDGIVPSYDEMAVALGMTSKSGICRLIQALEEKGHVRRLPNRARAIEPIPRPTNEDRLAKARAALAVATGGKSSSRADHAPSVLSLPVVGRIAAGAPIEAVETVARQVDVPASMLGTGNHFALDVSGLSMRDAGINDGDLAIVRKQDHARDGDIVVALVDGSEATLKTLRILKGGKVALQAENPDFPTRTFDRGRVAIQGKLVNIVRSYH